MTHYIVGAIVGFVVGAFTPSVGRRIKGWFVAESKTVVADVRKKL